MTDAKRTALRGVLHLWSETGTEGGHWAFQDARFIKPNTSNFHCIKCYKFWDKERCPDGLPAAKDPKEILVVTRCYPVYSRR